MKKLYILFSIFILHLFIVACSASSSTVRYGSTDEKKNERKDSVVRFSSDDVWFDNSDSLITQGDEVPEYQDPSDLPEDEGNIDISEIMKKFESDNSGSGSSYEQSTLKEQVLMEIIKYLNTPYKYGGNSKDGIDCSAFTQTVYRDALSTDIYRTARDQFTQGEVISSQDDLKFGDLVFFNTRRRVRPGHVGIYIGDRLFAHASTKNGVTISSLDHAYYSKRYMGARRISNNGTF